MAKIFIEWLHDTGRDCETCGVSYAEGAKVYVDGSLVIDMTPHAHCFGGANYNESEVFAAVLTHLGHEVIDEINGADPQQVDDK